MEDILVVEGVPRSGTRFFCKFLEKQFDIKIFRIQNEITTYYNLISKKRTISTEDLWQLMDNLVHEYNFTNRVGTISLKSIFNSVENPTFALLLNTILTTKARESGFSGWGLKFDNPSGMAASRFFFPDCKIIHIIRDGRDVNISACKCLNEGFHSTVLNARFWKSLIRERRNFSQTTGGGNYLEIRYEDVLSDPETGFNKLSGFLNISDKLFQQMHIKTGNFDKWKKSMSGKELQVYEGIAGDMLSELGYKLNSADTKKIPPYVIKFYEFIEPALTLRVYLKKLTVPEERHQVVHKIKLKVSRTRRILNNLRLK